MFGVSEKNMLQEPLHSRTAGTERVNFFVRDEWRIGVTRLCAVRQSTQKVGCALNSPRPENQDSATEEGPNEKLTLPPLLQTPPPHPSPSDFPTSNRKRLLNLWYDPATVELSIWLVQADCHRALSINSCFLLLFYVFDLSMLDYGVRLGRGVIG